MQPKIVFIIVGSVVALGAILFFIWLVLHADAVVVFDGQSFTPADVSVAVGSTVMFKNDSGAPFWPASDLHPSHSTYPEFDPLQPVAAGDHWSFTFDRPGRWYFHDHLNPLAVGVVTVGPTAEVINVTCNDGPCWENLVVETLKTRGMAAALTQFVDLYNQEPEFKSVCHDVMHSVGEEVYLLFAAGNDFSLTQDTSYCGYGFYHGFMETMLVTSGDLQSAREFCRYVDEQLSAYGTAAGKACYHGIGHGFTDGSDPRTWGSIDGVIDEALRMCEVVAVTAEEKYLCGTGVYNGLAIARRDETFGLTAAPETVFAPCANTADTEYKRGCYEQMNTLVIHEANSEVTSLLDIVLNIADSEYIDRTLESALSILVFERDSDADVAEISSQCLQYANAWQLSCINGIVAGIIEFGAPGREHEEALSYCNAGTLNDEQIEHCYRTALSFAQSSLGASAILDVCDAYEERFSSRPLRTC